MITQLFGRRPIRRSLENPATPLSDPDDWLFDAWCGGHTGSGVRVNHDNALTYSPFWRGVNLISKDVGKIPVDVYRKVGKGKERDVEHPAYYLVKRKPNSEMTSYQFRLVQQSRILRLGNSYAYIFRGLKGEPTELLPLDPQQTEPVMENGVLLYVTKVKGEWRKIPARDMLHVKGLGDGFKGVSVVQYARESLGLGLAAERYGSTFFRNSARPSVVIEHPGKLTEDSLKHLKESWAAMHSGLDNQHRTAILEEGMKLNPFGLSNEDAQFLQTKQQNVRDIANFLGLPPHKLGDPTRTSFASLEQENQSYIDDGLDSWFCNWEAELWDKLLTEEEKENDTHIIEFNRNALARANMEARSSFYSSALQNGWMNRDEVRARENMNPIPGGEGEKFFEPKNMDLTGEEDEDDEEETPPEPDDEDGEEEDDDGDRARNARLEAAHRKLLTDVLVRMTKRITTQARRRSKDWKGYLPWVEERLRGDHGATFRESAEPAVTALDAAAGAEPGRFTVERLEEAFFRAAEEGLSKVGEATPAELEAAVERACERMEAGLPALVAGEFLEVHHGA